MSEKTKCCCNHDTRPDLWHVFGRLLEVTGEPSGSPAGARVLDEIYTLCGEFLAGRLGPGETVARAKGAIRAAETAAYIEKAVGVSGDKWHGPGYPRRGELQ